MQMTTVTKKFGLACAAAGLLGLAAADASAASLTLNSGTRGQRVYAQSDTRTGRVQSAEVHARHDRHRVDSQRVDLAKNIGGVISSGRKRHGADMSRSVLRTAWLVEFARPQFDAGVVRGSDAQVPAVTRDAAISALQVAISEVCGDKPGQYDPHSGEDGSSRGVMNLPHDFLGVLGAPGLDALETAAIWANIASHQDQLAVNPIPEPGSLFLFAAGASLVAFAAARGRR